MILTLSVDQANRAVFGYEIQNSKKKNSAHEYLNLDEIKNVLRLLSINDEMNLIKL